MAQFGVNNLNGFDFMSKKRNLDDFFCMSRTQSLSKVVGATSENWCIKMPQFCKCPGSEIVLFLVSKA